MARSHTSSSASPTRSRSPQRSPARRQTSEDGSQYEIDMDALGLNSEFDSSRMENEHAPKLDVVDTSDIEGPEDFTMNMTYWMTADLPLLQVKSRKEAGARIEEVRGDARQDNVDVQDFAEGGDKAAIEETARDRVVSEDFTAGSPATRANGTVDESLPNGLDDSTMEHDEKVLSYLSALPDTDMEGAIASTPMKIARGNLLEVPTPLGPKARSLQATVEDYETPRKATQETVIRHNIHEPTIQLEEATDQDVLRDQMAELQSRLEQQELTSKTRITELETILSYTRSELDAARTENYKTKDQLAGMKESNGPATVDISAQIKEKEQELDSRMQEFGEELRLQNLAKLQNQREDFERQLRASEEAKRATEEQIERKDQLIAQLRGDLDQLRQSQEEEVQSIKASHSVEHKKNEERFAKDMESLREQLSTFQTRAESLQAALEKATAEAHSAREETDKARKETDEAREEAKKARQETENAREETRAAQSLHSSAQTSEQTYTNRISDLEASNQSLKTQLEALRADASSNDQQVLRISELESDNQALRTQLEAFRADASSKDQQLLRISDLGSNNQALKAQLEASHADGSSKDQQLLRISVLESNNQALKTELEAFRADASSKDQQLLRISDLECHIKSLKSQLEASRADASSKDQQLLRNIEEQEHLDQSLHVAQGRIEGLESNMSMLRQQLADAHRESSKARTEFERYEKDLEDWNERLEDAGKEADRRVADVEKKLTKMKEVKTDVETRFKELQSSRNSTIEDLEAQLEDVRSNAEDAVRKVGGMLETERSEKRRLLKDLKIANKEIDKLRSEVARKTAEEEDSSSDEETSILSCHSDSKAIEMENLRTLLRKQASEMKTLKSEAASLRKKTQSSSTTLSSELEVLRSENETLKSTISSLKSEAETQRLNTEAVNKAMDERLAGMLTKMLKERSRTVAGKRDDQWAENLGKLQGEREFMGKVLMREWGRQECGVGEEEGRQKFRYQYVKRA